MSLTINIDMDAILADLIRAWLALYSKDYPTQPLTVEDITHWAFHDLTHPDCQKKIYDYLHTPGLFENLDPIPDCQKYMKKLIDDGHNVFIVTATPSKHFNVYEEKTKWVEKHLPFFDVKRICFVYHKGQMKGDILFDDAVHNLESFTDGVVHTSPLCQRRAVCLDYPYNRSLSSYIYPRMRSWKDFYEYVQKVVEIKNERNKILETNFR